MSDGQEQDKSQKTEQPTPRRLEKAREEGQIPFSKDVGHWFMLLALTLMVPLVLPHAFLGIKETLIPFLGKNEAMPMDGEGLSDLLTQTFGEIAAHLFLPTLFILAAAITGALTQTQLLVSLKNLKPKLSKFSPLQGLKRLFGPSAWVEFLKNFIKFVLVTSIAISLMVPELYTLERLPEMTDWQMLAYLKLILLKLLGIILSIVTVLALLDYGYQKYKFIQNLKMSHQEIKDEYKESEGDPHVKQRLRQIRRDRAQRRLAQDVAEATVVLTNPTHFSVALKYEHGQMHAPILVAKGVDHLALHIRTLAKEHKVPIVENPPLTRALYAGVKEGEEIPLQYYEAVATILRYILKISKKKR